MDGKQANAVRASIAAHDPAAVSVGASAGTQAWLDASKPLETEASEDV